MRSLNRVMLIGNLGADPELRHTPSGRPVATLRLATTEVWGGRDGAPQQEQTEWHRVIAWGKLGEFCEKYLTQGKQVYIEGKLRTRSWQDRDGNKRSTTEIEAQSIVLLGKREDIAEVEPFPAEGPSADVSMDEEPGFQEGGGGGGGGDDEVPF